MIDAFFKPDNNIVLMIFIPYLIKSVQIYAMPL